MEKTTIRHFDQLLASLEEGPSKAPLIYCRLCGVAITSTDEKISVSRQHQHRFTNPSGLIFAIGCYQNAPGCSISELPTTELSWFPGYRWQLALCCECNQHLGWFYQSQETHYFFGLINERLIEEISPSD